MPEITNPFKKPKPAPPSPTDPTPTIGIRGHRDERGQFSDGKEGNWTGEIGKKWDEQFKE